MTVRAFVAWYLSTVALASALGVVTWHGIETREHPKSVAMAVPPPAPTPSPPQLVTEAPPRQQVAAQVPTTLPKLRPPRSATAALPPLRVASGTPWPVAHGVTRRPSARVAVRAPAYRYSPVVVAQGAEPYPDYAYGSYVVAWPPSAVGPWQMQPYSYYHPYYPYYVR